MSIESQVAVERLPVVMKTAMTNERVLLEANCTGNVRVVRNDGEVLRAFWASTPRVLKGTTLHLGHRSFTVEPGVASADVERFLAAIGDQRTGGDRSGSVGASTPRLPMSTAHRANYFAAIVRVLGWAYAIGGVVGGIALAASKGAADDFTGESTHPYVWSGIGVAFSAVLVGLVIVMVAEYIRAKTEAMMVEAQALKLREASK